MHPALQLDEILLNIFSYCNPTLVKRPQTPVFWHCDSSTATDLLALARTCHLFKEPALDVLWSELADLNPLARCLPEVCYPRPQGYGYKSQVSYTFYRPLEQEEWDTLRSYTRRIRSIQEFQSAFDTESIRMFLNPLNLLFPNLRHLCCSFSLEVTPLLRQSFPSLISLDYTFPYEMKSTLCQGSLESFPDVSPNLRQFSIRINDPLAISDRPPFNQAVFDQTVSGYICRWSNPRIISCDQVALSVDAIKHLSCAPDLSQLSFKLHAALPGQINRLDSLRFDKLQKLELNTLYFVPLSRFLACIQLPAITDFTATFKYPPSKQEFASFLAILQTSATGRSIMALRLSYHHTSLYSRRSDDDVLVFEDLRPLVSFKNLRCLDLDLMWDVNLTDDDLLELALVWPLLERLLINQQTGWRQTSCGVTPNAIVRLLQTCQSLCQLALAIDSRGSVDALHCLSSAHPQSGVSRPLYIDVVDSIIVPESVSDMVAFFGHLMSFSRLSLVAWESLLFRWPADGYSLKRRWYDTFEQAEKHLQER